MRMTVIFCLLENVSNNRPFRQHMEWRTHSVSAERSNKEIANAEVAQNSALKSESTIEYHNSRLYRWIPVVFSRRSNGDRSRR